MILTWPSSLPRPERNTWQLTAQDARRKRQSEAGPPSFRRRFSSAARMVSLSMMLDRNQRAIFDLFFHNACAEGTHLFWMPDPSTEGWPLLTSDGLPLLTGAGVPILLGGQWLCSWGAEMPVETVIGREFRKSFSVVVMP
jgi:hypothetical protein